MRRFDIWQSERESADVLEHGIRVHRDGLVVAIWNPKATKPSAHYRFRSEEHREDYIRRYVERFGEIQATKQASRQADRQRASEKASTVDVGHIFVNSWGYDQTNVDFYQVVEKHGQMLTLREIASSTVPNSEGRDCDQVKPRIGKFLEPRYDGDKTGLPFKKRLQFTGDGRAYVSMDHGWCGQWRGESHYRSWYA